MRSGRRRSIAAMSRVKILLSLVELDQRVERMRRCRLRQADVDAVLEHDVPPPFGDQHGGVQLVADRRILVEQRQEILGPGSAPTPTTSGRLVNGCAGEGLDHGAVVGNHLDLAVTLPQREGVAFGDRDVQPARIKLEHGGVGDPGIGLKPRPRLVGVEEQQRGPPGDAGGGEDVVARSGGADQRARSR